MNSFDLDDLKGTKSIEYDGECKKIKSWVFISDRYCVRGIDCSSILLIEFEDGEEIRVNDVGPLNNC